MLNWLTRYAPVRRILRSTETGSILDVGCGPHGLSCIDPDIPFVGMDTAFPRRVAPTMTALRSEPGPFPFADRSFDTVLSIDTLEHVPRPDRAGFVEELVRIAARRVVLACPSNEASLLDRMLGQMYAQRGVPAPDWLQEHDEHVLPTRAEIEGMIAACEGITATPLPMPNGFLSMAVVLGDMLPELGEAAAIEYRDNAEQWGDLFENACFGDTYRPAWILQRVEPSAPLVDRDRLEETTLAALRCPTCSGTFTRVDPEIAICGGCARILPLLPEGAWDLAAAQLDTHRQNLVWCEPTWDVDRLAALLRGYAGIDHEHTTLVLRARPGTIDVEVAIAVVNAALEAAPAVPEADILLLTNPLGPAHERYLRSISRVVEDGDEGALAA
jgi:hypothetical protein